MDADRFLRWSDVDNLDDDFESMIFQGGEVSGGVSGLRRGEDYRTAHPTKMYVIGRNRFKYFETNQEGDLQMSPPLQQQNVWAKISDRFDNEDEFKLLWNAAASEAFLGQNALSAFVGNDHNAIQGPGTFCFDVRLMKLMRLKEKSQDDINENMTTAEAIARLRSLHTTLQKAFGLSWLKLIQGSNNPAKLQAYKNRIQDQGPVMPLLSTFDENDLMLNTAWAGEGPYFENLGNEGPEDTIQRAFFQLKTNGAIKGLIYVVGNDIVELGKVPTCPEVRMPRKQDDAILDRKVMNLDLRNRKLVIGSVSDSMPTLRQDEDNSSPITTSPITTSPITTSPSTSVQSEAFTYNNNDDGNGAASPQASSRGASSRNQEALYLPPTQNPIPGALPSLQNLRPPPERMTLRQRRLRGGFVEFDVDRQMLEQSKSSFDTISRRGTFKRMRSEDVHSLSNGSETAAIYFTDESTGFRDLESLDIFVELPKASSVVTMFFGEDVQLWLTWFSDCIQNGVQPQIVLPTAYDAMGSFHHRMDIADAKRAMPDLSCVANLLSVFDMSPVSGHYWSPNVPCWSQRHVETWSPKVDIAQELLACKSRNVFTDTNPSVYGILCRVNRLRRDPKTTCVENL